jgi:hypothetical protein
MPPTNRALGRHKVLISVLAALVVILVAGRVAAPFIVARVVRGSLSDMGGGYRGDVDSVELSLLSGEVALINLTVRKENGRVPVPFMQVPRFVVGVVRDGGALYTRLTAVSAQLNWVDARAKAEQQWGPKFDLAQLREQLPLDLNEVRFIDGEAHLRNFEADPPVDVYVNHIDARWSHLAGCLPPGSTTCESGFRLDARIMKGAKLHAEGHFDRHHGADLDATARVVALKPAQLNPLLLRYAEVDVQQGTLDLDAHYHVRRATQRLTLIPLLEDLKIVGSEGGRTALLRELAAGAAAGFFERRKGEKAIAYHATGGEGEWSLVDLSDVKRRTRAM